ncbi:methyltransferase domain-containing protein [Diaphorobacter sp. HDW4A]|uniref:methyltransferase domain-containing protein n=1 Tax=Diaphorobacter sp. HDW4A TaxID=2714924 RepID=UPI00140E74B1|nr:methyltransferase domain-containing protein [Diaphorobacter sp. HDW4A]QIL78545.1 methyltransferase domain-containing protein [Diaphorobacter sp. HDW4A]
MQWVRARHLHRRGDWVPFWRCRQCRCLFSDVHENTYAGDLGPGFVKFYAELGAGVEPIAQMLMENLPQHLRTYADVGCGLGASLHLVERVLGVPALGFEPHPMLHERWLGGRVLPVALDQVWLAGNAQRFDLLLACEVIEHVPDPVSFATDVRLAMADALSVAVFSTPDADSITPLEYPSEIYSRLFPGEHYCLFTADMLRDVLLRAGFEAVEVVSRGGHLIASAGTAMALSGRRKDAEHEPWMGALRRYLSDALANADEVESLSPVLTGHAYRLFKALMNSGDFEAARNWRDKSTAFARLLDEDGLIRPAVLEHALSLVDFESYVANLPSFLGAWSYHLAMLARVEGRVEVAQRGLEQALALMQHETRIGAFCFIESTSLQGPARMELALVAAASGHPDAAFMHWQSMAQGLADVPVFARAAARLALDENARGNYPMVERIIGAMEHHPLRAHGLLTLLCDGDWEVCALEDVDLGFDFWIARFHSAMHARQSLDRMHEAYAVLGIGVCRHPDAQRQEKWQRVCRELAEWRRHHQLADRLKASELVHLVDLMWCDVHGVFVRGWVHAGEHEIRSVHLVSGEFREQALLHPRPDVVAWFPQFPRSGDCGFSAYLKCSAFRPVELEVDIGLPTPVRLVLELPPHLNAPKPDTPSSAHCLDRFRDLMKQCGGTVVVIGGRRGEAHPDEWTDCLLPECRVVALDIHPGEGVDVVGDAHALSQYFAPGSVDAVISRYVMEHLEAPWVVAAEINKVLRIGGLTFHHAPQTWPIHAAPNDFWRISDSGMRALFGPSMGFDVMDVGMELPARIHPPASMLSTQFPSVEMPVFDGFLSTYLLARKVTDLPEHAVRWPGTAAQRLARARTYPVGE